MVFDADLVDWIGHHAGDVIVALWLILGWNWFYNKSKEKSTKSVATDKKCIDRKEGDN